MSLTVSSISDVQLPVGFMSQLRTLAVRGLARMYRPDEGLFAFRVRRKGDEILLEGSSARYTAIALIGLAGEDKATQAAVLAGIGMREACARLVRKVDGL